MILSRHRGVDRASYFHPSASARSLAWLLVIGLGSFLFLFLGMSRVPQIYDEGLILTGAMRVGAGQIPHRDFYANYGPAQFYLLAALFKIFPASIFVERIYDACIKSLVIVALCGLGASYFRRPIAIFTALAGLLWLFCLNKITGTPVIPVSLLNLLFCALLLPVFERSIPRGRMAAAGFVAGLAVLFRYDTGLALFAVGIIVVAIAYVVKGGDRPMYRYARAIWPYVVGFGVVAAPAAFCFLAVSPVFPLLHDIILYPSQYYHRGRNLPFPRISLHTVEDIQVYLPLAAMAISFYVLAKQWLAARARSTPAASDFPEGRLFGGLVTFGLLALVMFFKGYVRMEVEQMYLCIIPSLLLMATLVEYLRLLSFPCKGVTLSLTVLFGLAVISATYHQVQRLYRSHWSVLEELLAARRPASPEINTWCKLENPLTRGLCFLTEQDRMQIIEFIDTHTAADQFLYVGLERHDKVFANDNLIYFGSQRLPATHWSHFDPGLQNRRDIQGEMIEELKRTAPPYIVLDSGFDSVQEPNDSSKSSGVTLLDDYIRATYRAVQKHGDLSIWQRGALTPVWATR